MLKPLPRHNRGLAHRRADFTSLAEALDYAAQGETGLEFYSPRGALVTVLPYAELRERARRAARCLLGLGLQRGARVALAAETSPLFLALFFGCQYAGVIPVPFPGWIRAEGEPAFQQQLQRLVQHSTAAAVIVGASMEPLAQQVFAHLDLRFVGSFQRFHELAASRQPLQALGRGELALIQYTSGSTRFPKGVMLAQEAVMHNVWAMVTHGIDLRPDDRGFSWLPFYHDMGLIGALLVSVASQMTTGLLDPTSFVMRPRLWPQLLSETSGSISFAPPFGYELAARRVTDKEAADMDLSLWRCAGIGADRIREAVLASFAERFTISGFQSTAFLPCYGLAECALAVSFTPHEEAPYIDCVEADALVVEGRALPTDQSGAHSFVSCGIPLPGLEVEIRDEAHNVLTERHVGAIYVRGASVMCGYLSDLDATSSVLSADGWLETGDLGYRIGKRLIVTSRSKDVIIVNGRKIWPQDIEDLAVETLGLRPDDVAAFAGLNDCEEDIPVLWVRRRWSAGDTQEEERLHHLRGLLRSAMGVECLVEAVERLPRTTSGKVARSLARKLYLEAVQKLNYLGRL